MMKKMLPILVLGLFIDLLVACSAEDNDANAEENVADTKEEAETSLADESTGDFVQTGDDLPLPENIPDDFPLPDEMKYIRNSNRGQEDI